MCFDAFNPAVEALQVPRRSPIEVSASKASFVIWRNFGAPLIGAFIPVY